MNLCAICGQTTVPPMDVCSRHTPGGANWAAFNRIVCGFIHRGQPMPRVPLDWLDGDFEPYIPLRGCE